MCKNCNKNPVYELTNKRKFCNLCFSKYLRHKIFSTITKYHMLSNLDSLYIKKSGHKSELIETILRKITDKRGISIKKVRGKGTMAIPVSLDDEAFFIINELLKKSPSYKSMGPVIKQKGSILIKPLYLCSDKEIDLYCRINKIRLSKKEQEKDPTKQSMIDFINHMEKRHPEIKNAIVNSYLEIKTVLK
jgi:tRNA(Ile)-lysidine synthase TilS/MesJ